MTSLIREKFFLPIELRKAVSTARRQASVLARVLHLSRGVIADDECSSGWFGGSRHGRDTIR